MIHTAKQLKDKVKNLSGGRSNVAQTLIRTYIMERFLERVSLSSYRGNFILKGGMLVASIVGVDMRATMDIDTTIKSLPLNENDASRVITEICEVEIEDGVSFKITSVKKIMEDFDYLGIRMILEATLERMKQTIKIDISTDDAITPRAVEYQYKLMFEERTISLMSYNLETLLAEKIQTILSRGIANTRMRDFYDVYEIMKEKSDIVEWELLKDAFMATCNKRGTDFSREDIEEVLEQVISDRGLQDMWGRFRETYFFVGLIEWSEIIEADVEYIKRLLIS